MPSNDLMGTLTKVLRLFRLLQTERFITRQRIAEELEVHPKTVKRYLSTLDAAGFHLDSDAAGVIKPRIRFDSSTKTKPPMELFSFSRDEMIWLYLQLSGVHHAAPPGVKEGLWERICAAMPSEAIYNKRLTSMLGSFEKGYKSYEGAGTRKVIVTLLEALYKGRSCKVTYLAPNAKSAREYSIEPYQLIEHEGGLYCYCHLGWATDGNSILMLAIERMQGLKFLPEYFEKSSDVLAEIEERKTRAFRITDDGKLLKFSVRFTPEAAPYATTRVWHHSQSAPKRSADGSVTLSFKATGRNEIVAWILGWGPACEVLRPKELREEVKGKLEVALARYRK